MIKTQLVNGSTVIMDFNKNIESVCISVWFKVGSFDEVEKNNGIVHFLEHMAFKSTKNRTTQVIAQEFDQIGGIFNAYTSRESTVYYMKVLKNDVEKAISILADILTNPLMLEDEIENEREVILQELCACKDDPEELIYDKFFEYVYKDQAFGRNIIGTTETIKGFSKKDLLDFVRDYYVSDKMFFVISGNFNESSLLRCLNDNFSSIQRKDSLNILNAKPSYKSNCFLKNKDLEQAYFMLGFEGVKYDSAYYYPSLLLANIFGGGMSSILFQEVREKLGLVYSISANSSSHIDTGCFMINFSTNGYNVKKILPIIIEQINMLKDYNKDDLFDRLTIAKNSLRASIEMCWESSYHRVMNIGQCYRNTEKLFHKNDTLDMLFSVDLDDLRDVINKIIKSEFFSLSAVGKLTGMDKFDDLKNSLVK
ncbi:insulinase family protein [Anaplasmataceae bacterium AB001_6]|nr:insulinase family protein [Anaplasmataceae bacterium AB001_6]